MKSKDNMRVKAEKYSKVSNIIEELEASIETLENELKEVREKSEDERRYWEESRLIDYPIRIQAYKEILAHLEKI